MQIIQLDPSKLRPYKLNAKSHPSEQVEKLCRSIAEFGWKQPLVISSANEVIVGHGRLLAAQKMALKQVPCVVADDLTEEQIRLYRIADNKTAQSDWLEDLLSQELSELASLEADLSLTGFNDEELQTLVQDLPEPPQEEEESGNEEGEQPELELRDGLVEGTVWQLGRHKLYCGDSTDQGAIALLLDKVKVTFVWSDPPYGIAIQDKDGRVGGKKPGGLGGDKYGAKAYPVIAGDGDTNIAVKSVEFCKQFDKSIQVWWGANNYCFTLPGTTCWIVWDKKTERGDLEGIDFADAELAHINVKSAVRVFRHLWLGMWKQSENSEARVHPTQKPIALAEWCFDKYGKGDDVIFDPFLGSGISIIAAEKMPGSRTVIGCELSPHYCEIIMQRWEKLTKQTATLIDNL